MTKTGSKVYKDMSAKVKEIEIEHEKLSKDVYNYEHKLDSLVSEREDCYTQLAAIYLPEMTAQSVKNTLKEVQGDVQKIFKQKQERRRELETSMHSSMKKKNDLESKLEEVTETLNQKAAEREKLKAETIKDLSINKDYVNLSSEANQSGRRLEKNKKRLEEFKAEAKEKVLPYNKNGLFTYLLNRKFGTSDYQGRSITKILDSVVAKAVDYKEMKKNYDFLRSMPELMNIEFNKRKEDFESLTKKVQKIEKEYSGKHGLTKVMEEGIAMGKSREEIMAGISKLDNNYRQYSQERKEIDNTKDEYHKKAVQGLKEYLKGDDIKELKRIASSTSGREDDKIVQAIDGIDADIRSFKDKSKEAKSKRNAIEEKLRELNDIKSRYAKKDYNSDRSYFDDGFNVNSLLIGYMLGNYSNDHCWNNIEKSQHFKSEESYSSSYHHDDDGGGGGGGGSGGGFGGGFSGGGGFGGGGFSSGGGF